MLLGQIEHQRPLPWDPEQMDPDKIVEDPPRCRVLHPFASFDPETWHHGF